MSLILNGNLLSVRFGTDSAMTPITGNRRLSSALEDRILALRQSGLSLSAVSRQLMDEGYVNTKGELYSTTTIGRAEARAKSRRS